MAIQYGSQKKFIDRVNEHIESRIKGIKPQGKPWTQAFDAEHRGIKP